jgi:hypothetical protein
LAVNRNCDILRQFHCEFLVYLLQRIFVETNRTQVHGESGQQIRFHLKVQDYEWSLLDVHDDGLLQLLLHQDRRPVRQGIRLDSKSVHGFLVAFGYVGRAHFLVYSSQHLIIRNKLV